MKGKGLSRWLGVLAVAALIQGAATAPAQAPKERATLKGLNVDADALAISPDGKLVAAGGAYGGSGELKLWDLATGKERTNFKGSTQWPTMIAFSPDGKTLAVSGPQVEQGEGKQLVRFYDPEAKKPTVKLQFASSVHALAYSPDGKLLALACGDKMVRVWDVEGKKPKFALKGGHTDLVQAVAYSPDGKTIASGGFDKVICLWDATTGKERA